MSPSSCSSPSHVLLDIEGTTCPVSFVAETLFPYASEHLGAYLAVHAHDPQIQQLVQELEPIWQHDTAPKAQQLLSQRAVVANPAQPADAEPVDVMAYLPYLQWLIEMDRKVTPLKELQGKIWAQGYATGELIGPLFADVAPALQRWHQQGLVLAVYSSGSVGAQQLIYGHSNTGDLRTRFSHWFDTRIGAKQSPQSYHDIAKAMDVSPKEVMFISDSIGECTAANEAGMRVCFSDREGNPERQPGRFKRIGSLLDLQLNQGPTIL